MGQSNRAGRNQKMYVEDHPDSEIYPLNCVPKERPKGSWTNGVLAWQKATASESAKIVGWLTPPRFKNLNHHGRVRPKPRFTSEQRLRADLRSAGIIMEEE
jgi:hypothetical protein